MKIGYARTSYRGASLEQQCERLLAAGCSKFFCDLRTGVSAVMPGRTLLLESLKEGDEVVVVALDRIARCSFQGHLFIENLKRKECKISSLSTFNGVYDPNDLSGTTCRFAVNMAFVIADLERVVTHARTLVNENSIKSLPVPFKKLADIYSKSNLTLQELFRENKDFIPFKRSYVRIVAYLEEVGLKKANVHKAAQRVAKAFNDKAMSRGDEKTFLENRAR